MMRLLFLVSVVVFFTACTQTEPQIEETLKPELGDLAWIDPFIGTAEHGHTYPGATVPFGMVQLSPDNGTQGWDWCSGYNFADTVIVGFSHTHLSGTGIGDLCDISVMPVSGEANLLKPVDDHKDKDYALAFSHDNEEAFPGYYHVTFNNGMQAEMTSSRRAGFHKYTFPEGGEQGVILDLGFEINWDKTLESALSVEGKKIKGKRVSSGWARYQPIFFSGEFSHDIVSTEIYVDSLKQDGQELKGKKIIARFNFNLKAGEPLTLKLGISHADAAGADLSFGEIKDQKFNAVLQAAVDEWKNEFQKVTASSKNEEVLRTFYTAVYRTMLAPVTFSDLNGNYNGPDSMVHKADYHRYDIFSLWDTFRAENPLFTVMHGEKINDMMQSILAHYEEYGLLPVWSLLGNETNTMTGYHAVPILADAILKGYDGFDVEKAYEAMKASSMQNIRGTQFYREYGYIPYDKEGQSVTKTLEYAYDDWCIAQVAKKLGHEEDYQTYLDRAAYYKNVFDPSTGFMRAKLADKSWKSPFDPTYSDHNFAVAEYTEGNAWQHSWFVPHDIRGLIELHGGNENFILMLDSLFKSESVITGENASADISGLIGQYAHGNEPSHHIAYMYNYAGAPWKTQEKITEIMRTQYDDTPAGLCGNEDCGQMSAWYVFSAAGLYPVNPAQGIYVIGSPILDEVTWNLGNGKSFSIQSSNVSEENIYVQSAILNGEPLERSYITHEELVAGGELIFTMGSEPNKAWASETENIPPTTY